MTDIKVVAGGVCTECGHNDNQHTGETTCDVDGCECTNVLVKKE